MCVIGGVLASPPPQYPSRGAWGRKASRDVAVPVGAGYSRVMAVCRIMGPPCGCEERGDRSDSIGRSGLHEAEALILFFQWFREKKR